MNHAALWISCLLLGPALAQAQAQTHAQAQALAPHDFAFGLPVITTKDAPAYRFALPIDVYRNTDRDDLGDIRLFNAQGDAVPMSLLRPTVQAPIHVAPHALPLFPLHEGARAVLDGVRVTIDSPGSAIKLQTQNGARIDTATYQYILDARELDAPLAGLRLQWPDAASDYSGRVRLEASDDLGAWRTVVAVAPIANLHANGQALIENRISLAPTTANFWRLTWIGAAPAFEVTAVQAESADGLAEPVRAVLDVLGTADPGRADSYSFDLGAHPPVTRVNVLLPEANTVLSIELSSHRTPVDPWHPVSRASFYRIKAADGEQQNAPLEITTDRDRYWRARIVGSGALPHAPPRLHVEWVPNEVTFLARGQPPFLFAYGSATAVSAETDLAHVPDRLEIAAATLGSPRALGGPSRLVPQPPAFPWIRAVLWSVLILAVALLAWMAYRLSKEPNAPV
jgi:hypothetical protein